MQCIPSNAICAHALADQAITSNSSHRKIYSTIAVKKRLGFPPYFKRIYTRGVTRGARGAQFPGRRATMVAPNHCGGRRMVAGGAETFQQCHKCFLQYSIFASERPQFRTWGRQTCFMPRALSKVVTPLALCISFCSHHIHFAKWAKALSLLAVFSRQRKTVIVA